MKEKNVKVEGEGEERTVKKIFYGPDMAYKSTAAECKVRLQQNACAAVVHYVQIGDFDRAKKASEDARRLMHQIIEDAEELPRLKVKTLGMMVLSAELDYSGLKFDFNVGPVDDQGNTRIGPLQWIEKTETSDPRKALSPKEWFQAIQNRRAKASAGSPLGSTRKDGRGAKGSPRRSQAEVGKGVSREGKDR